MFASALKILFPQNVWSIIVARLVYTCPDCLRSLSAMANDIFQDTVGQIKNFYQEHSYELGWRFLTCSKSVLKSNPKIAFINLNPRGRKPHPDHPWASCEDGSPYLDESWSGNDRGKDRLQIQIQKMFGKIREKTNCPDTLRELIESTLSGYFVPFRSRDVGKLKPTKEEAFEFGEKIWLKILKTVRPNLIVCIGEDTSKRLRKIIETAYDLPERRACKLKTGWGDGTDRPISAYIFEFGSKSEIRLLRLPQLSRFKLFTGKKRKQEIDHIFTRFCRQT